MSMEALVVGSGTSLIWQLPYLLSRAGFEVDVITTVDLLRASRFVRNLQLAKSLDEIAPRVQEHICRQARPYDWLIASDDYTLGELSKLPWPAEIAPRYLPLPPPGR